MKARQASKTIKVTSKGRLRRAIRRGRPVGIVTMFVDRFASATGAPVGEIDRAGAAGSTAARLLQASIRLRWLNVSGFELS